MFSLPFSVERSITISKPAGEVFKAVATDTWRTWSPWLIQEPECTVDIQGQPGAAGHKQAWNGKRIGSGTIEISSLDPDKSVFHDLHFLKPWKSRSKVQFLFSEKEEGTKVTWTMQGTLPIFLFWMKKMMGAWVGGDYDRGLGMLKDLLETGEVNGSLEITDSVSQKGFFYLGKGRTLNIKEIGPAMQEDLGEMGKLLEGGKLPKPDSVLSIYKKFNMASGQCNYISGFAYEKEQTDLPPGLVSGKVPSHSALQINHTGAYKHLGNGWSAGMGCLRAVKKKQNKAIAPYEVYKNDPHQVAEKELQTEIFFPTR